MYMKQISKSLKRCGIYMIINILNGNRYIGSSKDIQQRLQTHRSNLRHNHHHNEHLQNAWNKYGEKNFDYSILEFCEENIRISREQYYVDTLKPEYNISVGIVELPSYSEESRTKLARVRKQRIADGLIEKTHCSKLFVYNLQGEFVKEFNSEMDACRELGLTCNGVQKALRGENKHHHGYLLFREKQDSVIPYKRTKKVDKQYKAIIVQNDNEYYEFRNAKECSEFFNIHIVSVRGAILHNRKFLHKYMIKYKSAVS